MRDLRREARRHSSECNNPAYHDRLIAAGHFPAIDGVPANNIAQFDGVSWQPVGAGTDGPISALCIYKDDLIVGGTFTMAGGNVATRVARWAKR